MTRPARWLALTAVAGLFLAGGAAVRTAQQPSVAPADPVIDRTVSDGIDAGVTVWRDRTGEVVAVMTAVSPHDTEPVWCRLTVASPASPEATVSWAVAVERYGTRGRAAICVWAAH